MAKLNASALDVVTGYRLRRAQNAVLQLFDERFAAYGLRPTAFSLLLLIRDNPSCRQRELSEELALKPANMVAHVKELTDRGIITRRQANGDRRAEELSLTEQGHAILEELCAIQVGIEAECADRLGGTEQAATFLDMLKSLATSS